MRYTRFLILSGGLDTQNVDQAIAAVTPHAVDICSRIESAPGVKDHEAIRDFIGAVRAAQLSVRATSTHKPLDEVILSKAKDLESGSKRDSWS
jgi:phosphoribosylanthranilate isomerase